MTMTAAAVAQDLTKVRFYIKGSTEYFVRLDGLQLPVSNVQEIAPGEHRIEIWSPRYELFTGNINVPQKDSISYYRELQFTEEYKAHMVAREAYKKEVFRKKTLPLSMAGLGLGSAPLLWILRKNAHEAYVKESFKSEYFNVNEENVAARKREFILSSVGLFSAAGAAIGGSLIYWIMREKIESLEKPIFKHQNPFTMEMFELSYNPYLKSPEMGIKLTF